MAKVTHVKIDGISALLFLVGCSQLVRISGVGSLYGPDFLLPLGFLAVLLREPSRLRPAVTILGVGFIWLIGAIITDVVRQTAFADYSRGWAKIVFFLLAVGGLVGLVGDRIARLLFFFAGLAVAGLISTALFPEGYQVEFPWKFGYSTPVALLAVIASTGLNTVRGPSTRRAIGLPIITAGVNFLLNYRSMFAILIGSVGISFWALLFNRRSTRGRSLSPLTLFIALLVGLAAVWGAQSLYGAAASSGFLGQEAKDKYEVQTAGAVPLILGGRSEGFGSVKAIADSPVLGHGSWAKDRTYVAQRILAMRARGAQYSGNWNAELIPSHSYILGAWVEAGILGALFWAFVACLAVRATFASIELGHQTTPFAAFLLVNLIWSIPFSPFGADVRFFVAGQIVMALWIVRANLARRSPNVAQSLRSQPLRPPFHARSTPAHTDHNPVEPSR
jgi:hypothetical protein